MAIPARCASAISDFTSIFDARRTVFLAHHFEKFLNWVSFPVIAHKPVCGQQRCAGDFTRLILSQIFRSSKVARRISGAGPCVQMPVEPGLCINVLELSDPRDGFARNGQLGSLIKVKKIRRTWAMYYLTGARDLFGMRHYTQHRHPPGQSTRRLPNVQGDVPRLGWWRTDTIRQAALPRTKRSHLWRKPKTTLSWLCSYPCPSGAA
jgi:hypothetical protein